MNNEVKLIFHIYLSLFLKNILIFFSPIEGFFKRLANKRKGQFILNLLYQWLFEKIKKLREGPGESSFIGCGKKHRDKG